MVLVPFGKWSDEHRQRVAYSNGVLRAKLKAYEKELNEVQKSQKRYFNKCRLLEDLREGEINGTVSTATTMDSIETPTIPSEEKPSEDNELSSLDDPVELAGVIYSPDEAKALFLRMLDEIPQKETKVAILGTYEHVSTGNDIVAWALEDISKGSIADAEKLGQDLINSGYLRLIGQVGSKFANSSVMFYQWRKQAYVQAGKELNENSTTFVGGYIGDTISNYINNPHPDETPEQRLKRESADLDHRYKAQVQKLDDLRCNLEESIIDHFKFMERCEFDRLRAIKAVFLDFVAALSNVVPSIQSSVDKMLLFQEAVHPSNDLRYILESYRTGLFSPKVTIYDNYYNSTDDQTFGVDLELRCRGDRKRVPFIISSILSHMDMQYPVLENDEVRLGVWTVSVPLKSTHMLRKELNTGKSFAKEILQHHEAPIVASVLKLYLVELPDSLVPSQYYDIIRTIYSQHGNDDDPRTRISALQNTLAQMRVSNIATLDAITTHLSRIISITKASDEYCNQLAQEFSHCILRPRVQSSLTIGDRHAYRLMLDLLVYRERIFYELKRHGSTQTKEPTSPVMTMTSANPTRRPSLQNRLDALSLKIRRSNTRPIDENGDREPDDETDVREQLQQEEKEEEEEEEEHRRAEQVETSVEEAVEHKKGGGTENPIVID
jgi:hypothetical protein